MKPPQAGFIVDVPAKIRYKARHRPLHILNETPSNSGRRFCVGVRLQPAPPQRGASASAARMRAQERMPLWKLLRSYFSFGE
jgi:hypothetical protein